MKFVLKTTGAVISNSSVKTSSVKNYESYGFKIELCNDDHRYYIDENHWPTIEINSLEDLLKLLHDFKQDLIISLYNEDHFEPGRITPINIPTIIIYDGYIE